MTEESSKRKIYDAKYKSTRKETGYVRMHKWCLAEYRPAVNSIIDLLSCHKEEPASTEEFHGFISQMLEVAEKLRNEYDVKK